MFSQRDAGFQNPTLAKEAREGYPARKIAAITLVLWKKGERFNPKQLKPQAA